MNLNEALGRITDPEVKAFFEKMVGDQNSYITKLETQLKEQKATGTSGKLAGDDITQAYIRKKMREEVISKATAVIVASVGQEIFDAVKADYEAFLEKNMTPANTTEDYAVDAFNLVYGRCFAKKDHPVHQVGKGANPGATPAPQAAGTNGQQVAAVQQVIAGQPPVMTGSDVNAGQGIPGVQGEKVKSTKDAFSRFKDRIKSNGGNKFQ